MLGTRRGEIVQLFVGVEHERALELAGRQTFPTAGGREAVLGVIRDEEMSILDCTLFIYKGYFQSLFCGKTGFIGGKGPVNHCVEPLGVEDTGELVPLGEFLQSPSLFPELSKLW